MLNTINSFRHLLSNTGFYVATDHAAISHLFRTNKIFPSHRVEKLYWRLMEYKFRVIYTKPGNISIADLLSRHQSELWEENPFEIIPIGIEQKEICVNHILIKDKGVSLENAVIGPGDTNQKSTFLQNNDVGRNNEQVVSDKKVPLQNAVIGAGGVAQNSAVIQESELCSEYNEQKDQAISLVLTRSQTAGTDMKHVCLDNITRKNSCPLDQKPIKNPVLRLLSQTWPQRPLR
jgi:hypothetical protein